MATLPIAIGTIADVMPCLLQRLVELDRRQHQRHRDQHDKGGLEVDQAEHDVRAKSDTDADGGAADCDRRGRASAPARPVAHVITRPRAIRLPCA